jgi:hypothetical protein
VSSSPRAARTSSGVTSQHLGSTTHKRPAHQRSNASPVAQAYANEVVIHLAATRNCWVQLTTANGTQIYQGVVYAGTSMHWTEHQAVSLNLGNPGGVSLTVNGKNAVPAGSTHPVTLSLGPGQKTTG